MQKHRSSETAVSVLRPTTPPDIGQQTQRQRILDAMIESCAEKTYAATTITDIVAARPHLPHHLLQALRRQARLLRRRRRLLHRRAARRSPRAAHAPEDPPAEATRKAATAVLEPLAARPGLAQLLTGDAVAVDPAVVERYRRATDPGAGSALGEQRTGRPTAHTDPRLAFGQAQVLILNQIASRQAGAPAGAAAGARLPGGQPFRRPRGGAEAGSPRPRERGHRRRRGDERPRGSASVAAAARAPRAARASWSNAPSASACWPPWSGSPPPRATSRRPSATSSARPGSAARASTNSSTTSSTACSPPTRSSSTSLEERVRAAYDDAGALAASGCTNALAVTLEWFAADPDAARFTAGRAEHRRPGLPRDLPGRVHPLHQRCFEEGFDEDGPEPELARRDQPRGRRRSLARIYEEVVLGRAAELPAPAARPHLRAPGPVRRRRGGARSSSGSSRALEPPARRPPSQRLRQRGALDAGEELHATWGR